VNRDRAAPLVLDVQSQDGVAKYLQLRNALARAISGGQWKAGDQLPTEDELVRAAGVSLGTVQRAMRMLVDDQLVVRRQGAGTFVSTTQTPMNAPLLHCRFLDEKTGGTLPLYSRVVRRRSVRAHGRWSPYFKSSDIVAIERLFSINNEFDVYTHLYFERERFPALASISTDALTGVNFKDLISRDFHLVLRRFSEALTVREFPEYVCRAAGAPSGTFGAVLDIVAYDDRGNAVYFQDLFVPPNDRQLIVTP
jgi:GntR family transcriptional regulator